MIMNESGERRLCPVERYTCPNLHCTHVDFDFLEHGKYTNVLPILAELSVFWTFTVSPTFARICRVTPSTRGIPIGTSTVVFSVFGISWTMVGHMGRVRRPCLTRNSLDSHRHITFIIRGQISKLIIFAS